MSLGKGDGADGGEAVGAMIWRIERRVISMAEVDVVLTGCRFSRWKGRMSW